MSRIACVDVPALPLQLLLEREPDWRPLPTVVVKDDRPQGVILWANARARARRILPGLTYAAGQSLASDLRAAVVEPHAIEDCVAQLHLELCNFSPRVEPSPDEPGVFWIDPGGMVPLYGDLEQWAAAMGDSLRARGWVASIIVGFHRYRSYALARGSQTPRVWVVPDPHIESRQAAKTPLDRLGIAPRLRDRLMVLGIHDLGGFLRLPATQMRARLGPQAAQLHALASDPWTPLQPRALEDPVEDELQLEPPDNNYTRLLFGLKAKLHTLMDALAERHQAMSILNLQLQLDHAGTQDQFIEPAAPTLDAMMVIDLVRLRLESLNLPAPVEGVVIRLEGIAASTEQLSLFRTQSRRDLDAAARAIARVRAQFGPDSTTCARLRPAHLPEARFHWDPVTQLAFPKVGEPTGLIPLCRRVFPRALPLPPRPRHEPESWLGRRGTIRSLDGPYRISGGWWVRTVERDYYFAHTSLGEALWIYYDRPRRRWMLHGYVD